MPIINIQRRMAEQGRIRLGQKVTGTSRQGKAYTRPAKLDRFRFTSPNADLIAAIARQYGGQAKPWDNGGKPEHEVVTDATSVPVIVVKGGLSQWMETWSGGGCIHRCDGERNVLTDAPCDLNERVQIGRDTVNPHAAAKPTTRLSVMLTDIESLGVWRMETHGWNAAAEIPAMAELAMHVGDLVPATLHLVERRAIRDGETSRFVVPVLDLQVTKARLVELVGGGTASPALDGGGQGRTAIEAPRPDYLALLADVTDVTECRLLWTQVKDVGHMTPELHEAITAHADRLKAHEVSDDPTDYDEDEEPEKARTAAMKRAEAEQHRAADEARDADEPVDAEVVEDDDQDEVATLWQKALSTAGQKGMGGGDLAALIVQVTGRKTEQCTAADFRSVLQALETGEVPEAVSA